MSLESICDPVSTVLRATDSWQGFKSIKHIVVFGDSFSSVGYSTKDRHPSIEHPLGVDFPGLTSCERVDDATNAVTYEPNWVGHLVQARKAQDSSSPLLVYDYAVSGDTVARMKLWQIKKEFLPTLAPHPEWAPWTSIDTLFITWIGINDCTWNIRLQPTSAQASFDDLFATQDALYEAGARNFCLIDIPPVHKFPGGPKTSRARDAYRMWNPMLRARAEAFSTAHEDATVLLFSSWDVFNRLLASRQSSASDDTSSADDLFVDGFHPSSWTHSVIADELLTFLNGVATV